MNSILNYIKKIVGIAAFSLVFLAVLNKASLACDLLGINIGGDKSEIEKYFGTIEIDEEVDETSGIGKGTGKGNTDRSSGIGNGGSSTEETKLESVQSELKEYKEAVSFLKNKLHEVNILNAKLLFTNKLFRSYGLSNEQKMKVVETFDRAKSLREVKLVYSTMAESFGSQSTREEIVKESKKGSASKATASTKSEKQEKEIISESDDMKARFQKLANIL